MNIVNTYINFMSCTYLSALQVLTPLIPQLHYEVGIIITSRKQRYQGFH